ncbi:hypothetical protein CLOM_g4228 [Closterium sp. NIES-68]|nr:hypothetical protein CLOM_g4228 [Closterium sp. NIES-68]
MLASICSQSHSPFLSFPPATLSSNLFSFILFVPSIPSATAIVVHPIALSYPSPSPVPFRFHSPFFPSLSSLHLIH